MSCTLTERSVTSGAEHAALAEAIADVCDAKIVFLGEESSHGVGKTFQVKTDVVRELLRKCGFTHIAFESQIYDFIDLQERYEAEIATREALYDAIGGLWSRAAEIDPLVDLLHEKARTGELAISGFDGQTGGATQFYTQNLLPKRLAGSLPTTRQDVCSAEIGRLTGWKFDAAHPKDSQFDERVLGCAKVIESIALENASRDPVQYRLAHSFRSFLEFSKAGPDSKNDRDRLMFENFEWTIARLPHGTKTIVWAATVHGLRKPLDGWRSMASHAVRDMNVKIKSVGVIATSGVYAGPGGQLTEIALADVDSLEGQITRHGAELAYLDSDYLRHAGAKKSRVIDYDRYIDGNWGDLLDGVLVLGTEAPPTYVRPRKPMQSALE